MTGMSRPSRTRKRCGRTTYLFVSAWLTVVLLLAITPSAGAIGGVHHDKNRVEAESSSSAAAAAEPPPLMATLVGADQDKEDQHSLHRLLPQATSPSSEPASYPALLDMIDTLAPSSVAFSSSSGTAQEGGDYLTSIALTEQKEDFQSIYYENNELPIDFSLLENNIKNLGSSTSSNSVSTMAIQMSDSVDRNLTQAVFHTLSNIICLHTDINLVGPSTNEDNQVTDLDICNRQGETRHRYRHRQRVLQQGQQQTKSFVRAEPFRLHTHTHYNGTLVWTRWRVVYQVLAVGDQYRQEAMQYNPDVTSNSELEADSLKAMHRVVQLAVDLSLTEGSFGNILSSQYEKKVYACPTRQEPEIFGPILLKMASSASSSAQNIETTDKADSSNSKADSSKPKVNSSRPKAGTLNSTLTPPPPESVKEFFFTRTQISELILIALTALSVCMLCLVAFVRPACSAKGSPEARLERVPRPTARLDGMLLSTPRGGADRILFRSKMEMEYNNTPIIKSYSESNRPGTPTHERSPGDFVDVSLRTPSPHRFLPSFAAIRSSPGSTRGSSSPSSSSPSSHSPHRTPPIKGYSSSASSSSSTYSGHSRNSNYNNRYSFRPWDPESSNVSSPSPPRQPELNHTPKRSNNSTASTSASRSFMQELGQNMETSSQASGSGAGRRDTKNVPPAEVFLTMSP